MELESLIESAAANGASDLHLEAGMPAALRVRGTLRVAGEPIAPKALLDMARDAHRRRANGRLSWSGARMTCPEPSAASAAGSTCCKPRAASAWPSACSRRFRPRSKNSTCIPTSRNWSKTPHGLILVSGPTGSGKSSTLAALIQEINLTETRHIVTVESPIEYTFRPRRAYIRQREVGRDTPSFEQALLDALREDPDVLMVGEMRDPETMRLTLSASETGHLVLATVHSSTCAEALQRVASAFPAEIQSAVCAQLADCLVAVVSQRLRFRQDLNIRVPECEILMATHAVKNFIRTRDFFKIISAIETGADHGMWTFQRYAKWLETRGNFFIPGQNAEPPDSEPAESLPAAAALPPMTTSAPKVEKKAKPHAPTKAAGLKSNRSKASSGKFSRSRSNPVGDLCKTLKRRSAAPCLTD